MGTNTWRGSTRWRRALVVAGVALLTAAVVGVALLRADDDRVEAVAGTPSASPSATPTASLTPSWGGRDGQPGCVYDAQEMQVDAELTIGGRAPSRHTVTVTVTAYADENTSQPVGSTSRDVQVDGAVHVPLHLTFPVERPPLVDVDGVVACGVSIEE